MSSSTSLGPAGDSIEEIKKNIHGRDFRYGKDSEMSLAMDNTINELKYKLQQKNSLIKTSNDTMNDEDKERYILKLRILIRNFFFFFVLILL